MSSIDFLGKAKDAIEKNVELMDYLLLKNQAIELIDFMMAEKATNDEKMENTFIFIEGFLKAIPEAMSIRESFAQIRREGWGERFGFETVQFNDKNIASITDMADFFKKVMVDEYIKKHEIRKLSAA